MTSISSSLFFANGSSHLIWVCLYPVSTPILLLFGTMPQVIPLSHTVSLKVLPFLTSWMANWTRSFKTLFLISISFLGRAILNTEMYFVVFTHIQLADSIQSSSYLVPSPHRGQRFKPDRRVVTLKGACLRMRLPSLGRPRIRPPGLLKFARPFVYEPPPNLSHYLLRYVYCEA